MVTPLTASQEHWVEIAAQPESYYPGSQFLAAHMDIGLKGWGALHPGSTGCLDQRLYPPG